MLDYNQFIKEDDIRFVEAFLKTSHPNAPFSQTDCPLAVYALVNKAEKIFTLLLHKGALLRVEDLIRCVPETEYKNVGKILTTTNVHVIMPSILPLSMQENFEQQIHQEVQKQGLGEYFERHRRKTAESEVQELHMLVEHMASHYDKHHYELDQFIIGMLAQYAPDKIIEQILTLYPSFSHPQKLIACLGEVEILKQAAYDEGTPINIDAFVELIKPQFPTLSALIKSFAQFCHKRAVSLNNCYNIHAFLMHMDVKKGKPAIFFNAFHITSDNIAPLALSVSNDLRAIALRYVQCTKVSEFAAYLAQENPKTPIGCPNVFELVNFLAKLTNYFTLKILRSSSTQERELFLIFCIHLLDNLLQEEQHLEVNCAMAISLAINSHTITRLKVPLKKNMIELLAKCNAKLSYSSNYSKIREIMKGSLKALPCYFLLMKDLTFSGENSPIDIASLRGSLLKDFLSRQQHLLYFSTFETDILRVVKQFNVTSDDELNTMSLRQSRVGVNR